MNQNCLKFSPALVCGDYREFWLDELNIVKPNHRKTVTEAALLGGLFVQGIPADLGIMSDDAGQFNVFDHALCWIHAERVINRLIPLNLNQALAVEEGV